jgi:hypothetical protein
MRHDFRDVLVKQVAQLRWAEGSFAEPGWIRPSPRQGVPANFHAVRFSKLNYLVGLREVEGCRVGPERPPLHRIFGFHQVEFTRQCVRAFGEKLRAHGRADEYAATVRAFAHRLRLAE